MTTSLPQNTKRVEGRGGAPHTTFLLSGSCKETKMHTERRRSAITVGETSNKVTEMRLQIRRAERREEAGELPAHQLGHPSAGAMA
ncbi:hypothetical protein BDA96_09G243300 [Sorghum bicolor]|jgi:hypothetical protein|uniref:Uncharacterized protein n=2 Tax=Sorghum bicolor TaxID=4558 RepID=A0A921U643_SORBI|nr:hypothetical protein BDA96_09G243300 [Sorghum bicolor]KXG22528.1 hypothetical protein SORBI_3009G230300 [Sorghum bicolor]